VEESEHDGQHLFWTGDFTGKGHDQVLFYYANGHPDSLKISADLHQRAHRSTRRTER